MRALPGVVVIGIAAGLVSAPGGPARAAQVGECVPEGTAGSRCVYRSFVPSSGIVASCRDDRNCRVGYYYGDPTAPVWFDPPAPLTTLPRPDISWPSATLAHVRFDCGRACSVSYFLEVRRHRLSAPRWAVLAVDPRRLLLAEAEGHALVVRQVFSGREVARIERDWAPGATLGDAITEARFDPDARLTLTWLRGPTRAPVNERISIPSFARP